MTPPPPPQRAARLNPLHCGAVVASAPPADRCKRPRLVSIPFIAGQWSLLESPPRRTAGGQGFNPLHCGAVVASRQRRFSPPPRPPCFNPLHCGAVVASSSWTCTRPGGTESFQSPSLRGSGRFRRAEGHSLGGDRVFQSPSLRGSGRFARREAKDRARAQGFNPLHCGAVVASFLFLLFVSGGTSCFNPLHCGAVVASRRAPPHFGSDSFVSIPFIAGQWSLLESPPRRTAGGQGFNPLHCGAVVASDPERAGRLNNQIGFNPLHCGAVVASVPPGWRLVVCDEFQSPSLRGSGRFLLKGGRNVSVSSVSIPFIAGQWSLRIVGEVLSLCDAFLSIPFIAGQWSLLPYLVAGSVFIANFQSPSLRGSGRFERRSRDG